MRRDSVCTAFTPPSFLSTYIVCSSGWSKPVWNLLATIRKRYSGCSKVLAVCASGKPFMPASVYGLAAVLHGAREGDERLERIAALGEVLVDRQLVAHRVQARAGDDHRLGLAADLALHLGGEVLDADPHLLADRVRVQLDERLEQVLGLLLVVARVVLDLLQQPPVGLVGGVVREHVEDEPLLDRLAHAVEVEGRELAVGAPGAEQLERLRLRRGGEGEGREVGQPPALLHLGQDRALQLLLGRLRVGLLRLRLFERARSASTALRLFVLSPDCDECASSTITAKRLPGSSPISFAITGNFCSVVTMIVLPDSSASLSWREVVSMFSTTPSVCSNWRIVVWSWRSSTRRSVMTTIESKTRRSSASCSVASWWASQAMVKLLPLPAECWIR